MKLIPNWRHAWRMFSVQAMAIAAAIQAAWPTIPGDLKSAIPANVVHWVSLVLLVAGIAGRLVQQPSAQTATEP